MFSILLPYQAGGRAKHGNDCVTTLERINKYVCKIGKFTRHVFCLSRKHTCVWSSQNTQEQSLQRSVNASATSTLNTNSQQRIPSKTQCTFIFLK